MKHWLILFLFIPTLLAAQRDKPLRIELTANKDVENYSLQQLQESGCMIFYEGNTLKGDSAEWLFMHYDTNFQKLKNLSVPLPANLKAVSSCFHQRHLFVVFQNIPSKKTKTVTKTYLADIDAATYDFRVCEIKDFDQRGIFRLYATQKNIILCTSQKESENVFFYSLQEQQLHPFIISGQNIYSIEFVYPDSAQQRCLLGLVLTDGRDHSQLVLFETDDDGTVLRESRFPDLDNELYNSARIGKVNDSTFIVAGTYNLLRKEVNDALHAGVYSMLYQNANFQTPALHSYVKPNDNVATRTTNLELHLLVGDDLLSDGTHFALTSEIFYPEYVTSGSGYYDFYNNFIPAQPTFAGYRYINAFVSVFDTAGRLSWNYNLPFNDFLTQRLITRVSVHFLGDNAVIYYPYNFYLTSTLLHNGKVVEPLSTLSLETNNSKESVEYSKNLKMENWYGNNFIISGYQCLKNNIKGSKNRKYVFFANKLLYL